MSTHKVDSSSTWPPGVPVFGVNAYKLLTCSHMQLLFWQKHKILCSSILTHYISRCFLASCTSLSDHNETMTHLLHPQGVQSNRKTTSPGFFVCLCVGFCRHDGSAQKDKQAVRGVRWTFFISVGQFHWKQMIRVSLLVDSVMSVLSLVVYLRELFISQCSLSNRFTELALECREFVWVVSLREKVIYF